MRIDRDLRKALKSIKKIIKNDRTHDVDISILWGMDYAVNKPGRNNTATITIEINGGKQDWT